MEITRTFDILDQINLKYAYKDDILASRIDGEWVKHSSKEYLSIAYNIAYGLLSMGLKKGDKIVTISNNRPEWNFVDMGMAMVGITHVPVYPTISEKEYAYILDHAEPKLIILSDKNLYARIKPIADKVSSVKNIYTFNNIEGAPSWKEIHDEGEKNIEKYSEKLNKIKASIDQDEMVTILYTSGTTGMPKGVMLSHRNLVSNALACSYHHVYGEKDIALSFLPISHVYERMVNYKYQYKGISTYYAENIATIARDAKEIRPQIFGAVPRLLESIYDKIIGKGGDLKGIKKSIFFWAVKLGHKFNPETGNSIFYRIRLKIADKLVFSKWREAVGGCTTIITGGAAIQPRLVRVFWAAGIEVCEGYGLTETSPVVAVANQTTKDIKLGTAGLILAGVDVKIAEDGEILVKGPNLMLGYYKDPAHTKEVINGDGYFHTGDIGKIVDGKYLAITDRKKEIFKLSSGKYIAPQAIENKFKESFFIEQLMVIGENQKFASALISPNYEFLHDWASKNNVKYKDNVELIKDPKIINCFQKEVNTLNAQLGQVERIKRFKLVSEEWNPASGEMSPTLKLKRKVLTEKYASLIEEIFSVDAGKD